MPGNADTVEHFTIAYYFERFASATRTLLELIGEVEILGPTVATNPRRVYTTFIQELRAGAGFHMLSRVIGVDEGAVRLGHQVVDSASARTVSWVMEILPLPAGRDRVKPQEFDESGRMSLSAHVHRFSAAGLQFLSSIGMFGEYMHKNRRGFSTLAPDLRLKAAAKVGDRIDVRTSIAHLGNTSLSYLHRMSHPDGREIASLPQVGVHLDLDARRPTAMPPAIRGSDLQTLVAIVDISRDGGKQWPIPMVH
jgi:acyl-CoA thioesterase FadM